MLLQTPLIFVGHYKASVLEREQGSHLDSLLRAIAILKFLFDMENFLLKLTLLLKYPYRLQLLNSTSPSDAS